jgi:hypothetical protein
VAQRVGGRGHRLEADDVGDRGREDLRVGIAALEGDLDPAPAAGQHERPRRREREAVVERARAERAVEVAGGLASPVGISRSSSSEALGHGQRISHSRAARRS